MLLVFRMANPPDMPVDEVQCGTRVLNAMGRNLSVDEYVVEYISPHEELVIMRITGDLDRLARLDEELGPYVIRDVMSDADAEALLVRHRGW